MVDFLVLLVFFAISLLYHEPPLNRTYDLASRGKDTEGKNQCTATWTGATSIGYGGAFQYSCIHSGSNEYSGGPTAWYNYVLASAGTIYDENTDSEHPATNANTATESICPKGWTLPSRAQVRTIGNDTDTYTSSFSPVASGSYGKGSIGAKGTEGMWWSNEANGGGRRWFLLYKNETLLLYTSTRSRLDGVHVRCVQAS